MEEWWKKYVSLIPSAGIFYPEENWCNFLSSQGYRIHTYRFNHNYPKGIIFMFHGLRSNAEYLSYISKYFYENGYTVLAMDQQGHGKSEGPRSLISSVNYLVDDSLNYIEKSLENYDKNLPVFVIGESLGGCISLNLSLRRPEAFRGAILLAPAVGVSRYGEGIAKKLTSFMSWMRPNMRLMSRSQSKTSKNPYYPDWHRDNPLIDKTGLPIISAKSLMQGLADLQKQVKNITIPFLTIQGGKDYVISAKVTQWFVKEAKSTDKNVIFYDNLYHAIGAEPEIDEILDQILNWMNARI